jgi:hypothetical protein
MVVVAGPSRFVNFWAIDQSAGSSLSTRLTNLSSKSSSWSPGWARDEGDDLAEQSAAFLIVASGLADHPEAVPPIMDIGEAFEEVAGGALGFVELAGTDEVDGGVGRDRLLAAEKWCE